jgi:hypothetical protein
MDEHHAAQGSPPAVGHEERDIRFWPIVAASAALLSVTLVVFVSMRVLFVFYDDRAVQLSPPANPLAGEYGEPLPPRPRLQTHPVRDLVQLRAAEETMLTTYGWVDAQAGVVRIPIARAMELLAQNPPPARAERGGNR